MGQRGRVLGKDTAQEQRHLYLHIQQPQYNKHGQTVTGHNGTETKAQQNISKSLVRHTFIEATAMATDHTFARELSSHTRVKHRIYAKLFRGQQRITRVQGL